MWFLVLGTLVSASARADIYFRNDSRDAIDVQLTRGALKTESRRAFPSSMLGFETGKSLEINVGDTKISMPLPTCLTRVEAHLEQGQWIVLNASGPVSKTCDSITFSNETDRALPIEFRTGDFSYKQTVDSNAEFVIEIGAEGTLQAGPSSYTLDLSPGHDSTVVCGAWGSCQVQEQ